MSKEFQTFEPEVVFSGLDPVVGMKILSELDGFFQTDAGRMVLRKAADTLSDVFYSFLKDVDPIKDPYAVLKLQQKGLGALGSIEWLNEIRTEAENAVLAGQRELELEEAIQEE